MEELPTAWADLPASWDVISATVQWNGIEYRYLTVSATATGEAVTTTRKPHAKRGPPGIVAEAVRGKMLAWVEDGRTLDDLKNLQQKQMPNLFGGSETTCVDARKAIVKTLINSV